jgi:hypothetical protein
MYLDTKIIGIIILPKDFPSIYPICVCVLFKYTLENTEGAIKKGQSRKTGNIGYQDDEKQNKNTTQHSMCRAPLNVSYSFLLHKSTHTQIG